MFFCLKVRMDLETLKGTKDFLPVEMFVRNKIVATLQSTFERFGFEPLETPILEFYKILASKYAGGAEILKETYRLKDQGGRDLALRYDLTVPLARFIGMNTSLKFPFKRYEIGKVFRDGPIKTGRMREFWQCDVDIVGCKEMTAEAEIISLTLDVFKRFDQDVQIKVNNRKIIDSMLRCSGVPNEKIETVILTIDKLEKFGKNIIKKELEEKKISDKVIKNIFKSILVTGTVLEKIERLSELLVDEQGKQGLKEIKQLFDLIQNKDVIFDTSLARGLSYYTGTVFEVFLKKGEIKSAVAGGGRYDKLIGSFLNSKQEYPAVGISFGLEAIAAALKETSESTKVKVFVIPIGEGKNDAFSIANKLRETGINTDIDLLERGPSKNLDYANSKGVEYVLLVGPKEIKEKKFTLKNMRTGRQSKLSLKDVIKKLS